MAADDSKKEAKLAVGLAGALALAFGGVATGGAVAFLLWVFSRS